MNIDDLPLALERHGELWCEYERADVQSEERDRAFDAAYEHERRLEKAVRSLLAERNALRDELAKLRD